MTLPERAGSNTAMYFRYLEITGIAFLHTQITTVQSQGFQRSDVCSFPKLCTAHISHVHEIHLSISLALIKRLTLACLDLNSPHLGICTIPQQLVSVFRAPVCCSDCSHMRQLKRKIITPSKLSTFKKYKCTPDILFPVLGSSVSFMRGVTFTRCERDDIYQVQGGHCPMPLSWARLKRRSSPPWWRIAKCNISFSRAISIYLCTRLHAKSINRKGMREFFSGKSA